MTNLFAENNDTKNQDQGLGDVKFDDLVGEDKRYKNSDELAKSKIHGDATITALKTQLEELANDLRERETVEKMLEKLNANQEPNKPPVGNTAAEGEDEGRDESSAQNKDKTSLSKDDIEQLLNQREQEKEYKRNLDFASQEVVKNLGSEEAGYELITNKARELGMTREELQDVAKQRPKAFLTLVGLTSEEMQEAPSTPASQQRSMQTYVQKKGKGFKYPDGFDPDSVAETRRNNRQLYMSPGYQKQLLKIRIEEELHKRKTN